MYWIYDDSNFGQVGDILIYYIYIFILSGFGRVNLGQKTMVFMLRDFQVEMFLCRREYGGGKLGRCLWNGQIPPVSSVPGATDHRKLCFGQSARGHEIAGPLAEEVVGLWVPLLRGFDGKLRQKVLDHPH